MVVAVKQKSICKFRITGADDGPSQVTVRHTSPYGLIKWEIAIDWKLQRKRSCTCKKKFVHYSIFSTLGGSACFPTFPSLVLTKNYRSVSSSGDCIQAMPYYFSCTCQQCDFCYSFCNVHAMFQLFIFPAKLW